MASCRYEQTVARWFDGETVDETAVRSHLDACARCRAYLARLKGLRARVAQTKTGARIEDTQLPAFLRELEQRIDVAPARRVGVWAMASVGAAAIVVAVSVLSIFSSGPKPIEATVIEHASTDIDGATTETYITDDGTATVWVNLPEGDLW